MANGKEGAISNPPYIAWSSFENFIKTLHDRGVPPRVDTTVMKGMSGSTQSQLRTALRFLRLISDTDAVTDRFRDLVKAYGTEEWPQRLDGVITFAYDDIIDGLDIEQATEGQLRENFRLNGKTSGSVLDKAVRFWLTAAEVAGLTLSPHFKRERGRTPAGNGERTKRSGAARPRRTRDSDTGREVRNAPEPGEYRFPIPGKGEAVLKLSENINAAEWDLVDHFIRGVIALKEQLE